MHGKKIQEVWGTRTHYERPTDQVATSPNLSAQAGRHRSPALHTRSQDPQGRGCFSSRSTSSCQAKDRRTDLRRCPKPSWYFTSSLASPSAVMPVSGLSGAGCVWVLSLCVLLLSSGRCDPVPSPEERRSAPGVVDEMDMQEVLGQFLQVLNWTDQGPRPRPRSEPPEYMLELYNRFNNDHSAAPSANIIRSFRNEGEEAQSVLFLVNITGLFQLLTHKIFTCHTISESWHSNSRSTHQICKTRHILSLWLNFMKHFLQNTTHKSLCNTQKSNRN